MQLSHLQLSHFPGGYFYRTMVADGNGRALEPDTVFINVRGQLWLAWLSDAMAGSIGQGSPTAVLSSLCSLLKVTFTLY